MVHKEFDLHSRYSRQVLFKPIGNQGQKRIEASKVGILGAGALGTNIANTLSRCGVGEMRIADFDNVELSNLPRQMLFTEADLGKNKAQACCEHIGQINSQVVLKPFTEKITQKNFVRFFAGIDILMDATDNFSARFLINEKCLELGIVWFHTGVTASNGQSVMFVPGQTACYRCLFDEIPNDVDFPNAHNYGIISPIVSIMSSISCARALRFIVESSIDFDLVFYDCWEQRFRKMPIKPDLKCQFCRGEK